MTTGRDDLVEDVRHLGNADLGDRRGQLPDASGRVPQVLRVLGDALKNPLHDHFHPGDLCRNLHSRNGIIALPDPADVLKYNYACDNERSVAR